MACGGQALRTWSRLPGTRHFNPQAPQGGPTMLSQAAYMAFKFQSTDPSRGPTGWCPYAEIGSQFQSTDPSRGPTACRRQAAGRSRHFNPRTPPGVRHAASLLRSLHPDFNPQTHSRGPTLATCCSRDRQPNFNPRAPRRSPTRVL